MSPSDRPIMITAAAPPSRAASASAATSSLCPVSYTHTGMRTASQIAFTCSRTRVAARKTINRRVRKGEGEFKFGDSLRKHSICDGRSGFDCGETFGEQFAVRGGGV